MNDKLVLLVVAVIVALAGCSRHVGRPDGPAPPALQSSHAVRKDLTISPPGWPTALRADLYRPDGAGPHPSVLLIHGGAWKRGDRDQVDHHAEQLAKRGYLVVNTTYRLVPEAIFPAQLHDVQQALRWMRTSGPEFGIDPARIATFGYSAGAHLAALAGHIANDPVHGDPQTRVQAIVAGGTPSDLTKYEGGTLVPAFIGGPKSEMLETYRLASPVMHVNGGDPPVFQYHATWDGYVPFDHATDYKAALDRAGIPNEFFVLRGRGHLLGFFTDGAAIEAAIAFLDRHLRTGGEAGTAFSGVPTPPARRAGGAAPGH